jgi:membrane protease YdiL (CAAX protease family)
MEFQNSQDENQNKFSYSRYGIRSILFIILAFFIGSLIYAIVTKFIKFGNYEIVTVGIIELVFILLPAIYFASKSRLSLKTTLRLEKLPTLKQVIFGLMGLLALQVFASCYFPVQESLVPAKFLGQYREIIDAYEQSYMVLLSASSIPQLILIIISAAVIPAISEEAAFRGLLQRSLEQEWLPIRSIVLSSLVFGMLHMNPFTLVPLIAIGFFMGFMAYISESLVLPIALHFIHNTIAIVAGYNPYLKSLDTGSESLDPTTAGILCFASLFISTLCIYYLFAERIKRTNLPEVQ